MRAANDRLAKTFIEDVEVSNRKLAKNISGASLASHDSFVEVPRMEYNGDPLSPVPNIRAGRRDQHV